MSEYILELDGLPPSINKAFPSTRSGRRFKSKEYTQFTRYVADLMTGAQTPIGHLSVEIDLIAPDWHTKSGDARIRDCGNYSKTLIDAVFANLDTDDKWIWSERIKKVDGPAKKTIIRIFELDFQ